jgi:hypothetical protein
MDEQTQALARRIHEERRLFKQLNVEPNEAQRHPGLTMCGWQFGSTTGDGSPLCDCESLAVLLLRVEVAA